MGRRRIWVVAIAVVIVAATVVIAIVAPRRSDAATARWIGTWAAAQHGAGTSGLSHDGFDDQTIRMTVHTSIGGTAARIRLSNVYGTGPLTVNDVTVGLPDPKALVPGTLKHGSMHPISFGGQSTVVIPRGGQVVSDAVEMRVPALSDLTVSMWLPQKTGPTTFHTVSRSTSYVGRGDEAQDVNGGGFAPISLANPIPGKVDSPWFYLSGVDVLNASADGAVVVFGDSISDGFTSGLGANGRWPDLLARRLAALPAAKHAPAVLNASLSGNSLGFETPAVPQLGPDAMSRLTRDVLGQTGVRTVIMQLGINDIQIFGSDPEQVVDQLRQTALQAHEAGLRVMICTLMPWQGNSLWTAKGEKSRETVNAYIRSTKEFDRVIDLDTIMRDPLNPTRLNPGYDSGDHLHPNPKGYQLIADSMPVPAIVAP
jgi:lysophospholipase L1-like esterase